MSLYQLTKFRNELVLALNTDEVTKSMDNLCERISEIYKTLDDMPKDFASRMNYHTHLSNYIEYFQKLNYLVSKSKTELTLQLKQIDDEIQKVVDPIVALNLKSENAPMPLTQVRQSRGIVDSSKTILSMIRARTHWKYPALQIGCSDPELVGAMVAADPLYVVDPYREFLFELDRHFTDAYVRRMRKYQVVKHNLGMLPQNQFGFVFSWGYFNLISIISMKQYLEQIFDLLRPGGVFLFSYNNSDTLSGIKRAEQGPQTYLPNSILRNMCDVIGYELVGAVDFDSELSIMELKKPGTLVTNKAHQVLGEIKRQEA